jgi:hypothetical protein
MEINTFGCHISLFKMGWNKSCWLWHEIVATFFENEIIYQFRVLKNLLTYNGGEWVVKFEQLCKNYEIVHQYIAL